MIEQLAWKFSKFVKENNPNTKSLEVINYGMTIIFNFLFATLITVVTSLILGTFKETFIVMISFALLRQFTGGYHLKTSDMCVIASSVILLLIPYIYTFTQPYALCLNIFSLVVTALAAPHTLKFKFAQSPQTYMKFKLIAIAIILSNMLIIKSSLISLTFFIVVLTLLIGLKPITHGEEG